MRLTDTFCVEWDGSCWVLTEVLKTTKRKGGKGEREQRRYFTSLQGAVQRAVELCGKEEPSLDAALLEMRKLTETLKGLSLEVVP